MIFPRLEVAEHPLAPVPQPHPDRQRPRGGPARRDERHALGEVHSRWQRALDHALEGVWVPGLSQRGVGRPGRVLVRRRATVCAGAKCGFGRTWAADAAEAGGAVRGMEALATSLGEPDRLRSTRRRYRGTCDTPADRRT